MFQNNLFFLFLFSGYVELPGVQGFRLLGHQTGLKQRQPAGTQRTLGPCGLSQ